MLTAYFCIVALIAVILFFVYRKPDSRPGPANYKPIIPRHTSVDYQYVPPCKPEKCSSRHSTRRSDERKTSRISAPSPRNTEPHVSQQGVSHRDLKTVCPSAAPPHKPGPHLSMREASPSEKEKMGRDFEKFIRTRFNESKYKLIDWRGDKHISGWAAPESSRYPDLQFTDIASGSRFAVECKCRRAEWSCLWWTNTEKLKIYKDYSAREQVPVFIAIGIGPDGLSPDSLFIVPLAKMHFDNVSMDYLENFRIPAHVHALEFSRSFGLFDPNLPAPVQTRHRSRTRP